MYYPEEAIEEVRIQNDIVEVASNYLKLDRKGRRYFALCPFHGEKTPSFSIEPSKQFFYCFGCNKGGSVIHFIMNIENLEETLATRADHEAITHEVTGMIRGHGCETLTLSTEACAICSECAYPNGPCRHPDKMFPCVESHGILVTDLCERFGMEFFNGNIVTWFSLIFFR